MKLQRESWMKQKRQAEEEKNPTIHPSPGYSFIVSSPQRMQRPSNERDENERLYDHWYQRASDWQKSTTKDSLLYNMLVLPCYYTGTMSC